MKRAHGRYVGFTSLLFPALLLGVPVWLTWRAVRQERLDRALIAAIRREDTHAVVSLLRQGADANARDQSPFHGSLLHVFLDEWRGRQVPASTALLVALEWHPVWDFPQPSNSNSNSNMDTEPSVLVTDESGRPLVTAFGNSRGRITVYLASHRPQIVHALVDRGANINVKDEGSGFGKGETPLIRAVKQEDVEVVKLLLDKGADVHAKDTQGTTALMAALNGKDHRIVDLLKQAGAKE